MNYVSKEKMPGKRMGGPSAADSDVEVVGGSVELQRRERQVQCYF